jgi:hypothetical protein
MNADNQQNGRNISQTVSRVTCLTSYTGKKDSKERRESLIGGTLTRLCPSSGMG